MSNPAGRLVVDASLILAWFFKDEATAQTNDLLDRLRHEGAVVPSLWPLEVANAMLVGERGGRVTQADAVEFVSLLRGLPITIDEETSHRVWDSTLALARAHTLTVYDAAYLELALRLGLPLATLDTDLRAAAAALGLAVL